MRHYQEKGEIDVSAMEALMEATLAKQLLQAANEAVTDSQER